MIPVNKSLFIACLFIVQFSVFSQQSEDFKQIWYNEKLNGLILESSNSFKLFYFDYNPILLEKINKINILLKKQDIFSFNSQEIINDWQLIDSNLEIKYKKNHCRKLKFSNENFKEKLIFNKKKDL